MRAQPRAPGKGQKCPPPADQTAGAARASGGRRGELCRCSAPAWQGTAAGLGAGQLGSPWQAGLRAAGLLSQSGQPGRRGHCVLRPRQPRRTLGLARRHRGKAGDPRLHALLQHGGTSRSGRRHWVRPPEPPRPPPASVRRALPAHGGPWDTRLLPCVPIAGGTTRRSSAPGDRCPALAAAGAAQTESDRR